MAGLFDAAGQLLRCQLPRKTTS